MGSFQSAPPAQWWRLFSALSEVFKKRGTLRSPSPHRSSRNASLFLGAQRISRTTSTHAARAGAAESTPRTWPLSTVSPKTSHVNTKAALPTSEPATCSTIQHRVVARREGFRRGALDGRRTARRTARSAWRHNCDQSAWSSSSSTNASGSRCSCITSHRLCCRPWASAGLTGYRRIRLSPGPAIPDRLGLEHSRGQGSAVNS